MEDIVGITIVGVICLLVGIVFYYKIFMELRPRFNNRDFLVWLLLFFVTIIFLIGVGVLYELPREYKKYQKIQVEKYHKVEETKWN